MAGDSLEAPQFLGEIRQPDGVMQNPVRAVIVRVGSTYDANQWKVLTICTGNGIQHTEPTDGEGDSTGADTATPGIAICSIPGVQFIATANQAQPGLSNQVVEQGEIEVAGNSEDILDPHLDQSARKVASEGRVAGGGGWGGGDRVATSHRRTTYGAVGGYLDASVDAVDLSVHRE
jgi:hypothetical protein